MMSCETSPSAVPYSAWTSASPMPATRCTRVSLSCAVRATIEDVRPPA
jgi:hypothetical protein